MATLSHQQKRTLLWLACSAIFFEAFDVSIVNLALTSIAADIGISLPDAQWVQTIYIIMFGSFLLLGGRLSDSYGSKHIFLVGMFLFGASSALAFISHNLALLLILRGGQGIGTALAMPAGISLLSRYFDEGEERNNALGIFGSFAAIGFAGGLALGGVITSYFNWHWIFSINVPIIFIVLLIGYFYIPTDDSSSRHSLNVISVLWLVTSLLLACFSIHEMPHLQITGVLLLIVAMIAFRGMLAYDSRQLAPFFDKSIYRHKGVIKAQIVSLLFGACFLSYVFVCILVLQNIFTLDQRAIGFLLFPYSITSAIISKVILPVLFKRNGIPATARLSVTSLIVGVILLFASIGTQTLWLALVSLFCINSFCISIGYPALTIMALSGIEAQYQGTAAGLQSSIYSIGSSIGLSAIAFCLQIQYAHLPAFSLLLSCCVICILALSARILLIKN